jgi:hypothetical protein
MGIKSMYQDSSLPFPFRYVKRLRRDSLERPNYVGTSAGASLHVLACLLEETRPFGIH